MTQDTVSNIQLDVQQKNGYTLNQITFRSGYSAFEKSLQNGRSKFTLDKCCMYKITNAGYTGKPDWIEFVKNCDDEKFDITSDHMRYYVLIFQNALTNAVTYYQGESQDVKSEADILETASIFAKGIITGAQELAQTDNETSKTP